MSTQLGWKEVKAWALAHGAKNDRITSIRIDGRYDKIVVIMEGWEWDGNLYFENPAGGVAHWRTAEPLRFFPGQSE